MAINLSRVTADINRTASYVSRSSSVLSNSGINLPNDFSSIETVTKSTLAGANALSAISQPSKGISSAIQNGVNSFASVGNVLSTVDSFTSKLNKQTAGITGLISSAASISNSLGSLKQSASLSNLIRSSVGEISTLSSSIESVGSVIPSQLNDSNTTFSSPLSMAFDPGRNKLQDLINSNLGQINPQLQNTSNALNSVNDGAGTGIAGILNKIPELGSAVSQSLGNLNLSNISNKISNALPPTIPKVATDLGNIINPLSNTVRDISANLNNITSGLGQISSGAPVNNFQVPIGNKLNKINQSLNKVSNTLNTVQSVTNVLQNPNQISNILGNKVKSLIDSKLSSILNPINSILENMSSLGKSLSDLASLDFSKINVLNPNEIFSLVGGRFAENASRIVQLIDNIENNQSDFFVSNNKSGNLKAVFQQMKKGRDGSDKLGNELRNFNTYNYIITLGMLSIPEYNSPSNYVSNGLTKILARSGGGEYSKRIKTFDEETKLNGGNAEYFIEDVEIDSVIAPNPNTGIAMGTNINFRIVEPYSMGLFLEAIKQEANINGFSGTGKAPFCLRIEFVGWDEYGNSNQQISSRIKPRHIPILITKVDFSVSEQGCSYEISAVAYSDAALEDTVNSVKTDISSQGVFVHEVLENSNESISRVINSHIENLEQNKQIVGYDRYLILFPNNKTDIYDAIKGNTITTEELTAFDAGEQLTIDQGTSNPVAPENPQTQIVAKSTTPYAPPKIYKYLKIWGSRENNINVIGKSPIAEDSNSNRLLKHPDSATIYSSENGLFQRDYPEAQVPQKGIAFEYSQGQAVTEIIEDVVLNSRYIFDAPEEQNSDAKKKWFRIETMVFIEENDAIDSQLGRPRMTYVYAVHPYFPDEAKFLLPNEAPRNNAELKAAALKEYDYIYTGKNEDVMEFDINFNNAFFQLVLSDLNTGNQKPGTRGSTPGEPTQGAVNNQSSRSDAEFRNEMALVDSVSSNKVRGTQYSPEIESKRRIAESFHDRLINETVDMITCDMKIWGDPFFLPTDQGNYRSKAISLGATSDGTMEYLNNEVTCVVNFLTPVDYPNKNGQFVMDFPELSRPFSGLFQIWAVTNSFSAGQYTQQLKLIRRPRQTDTPTGTSGLTSTGNIQGTNARIIDNRIVGGL